MPEPETARGPSILVVDDDDSMLALVDAVLSDAGYHVLKTENGREALRQVDLLAIDLVLLDIIMPDQDGIETVQEIRRQHPDLPVVVMSGSGPASTYLRIAQKLGATEILPKPFAIDVLLLIVNRLVGGRRAEP
jgi:DNA-binding NtrC family response regulator